MPALREPGGVPRPKVRVKKPTAAASYAARPVVQRKAQLATKGVLAPAYEKTIKTEHKRRVVQLKTSLAARERAAKREFARAIGDVPKLTPGRLTPVKPKPGGALATIRVPVGAAIKAGTAVEKFAMKTEPKLAAALFPTAAGTVKTLKKAGIKKPAELAYTIAKSAPADVGDLAMATPSTLYHLGSLIVRPPGKKQNEEATKIAKGLAEPYIHPKAFLEKAPTHPVSTFLAYQPLVRAPGLVAGKALRVAGKQSLTGTPKTLPGTPLSKPTVKSRGALRNLRQTRAQAKAGPQVMSHEDVQKAVDAFHELGTRETAKAQRDAYRHAKKQGMTKEERAAHVEEATTQARAELDQKFAREFGAMARPSIGAAEKQVAQVAREAGAKQVKVARKNADVANAEHTVAMTNARLAVARAKRSPTLTKLEAEHRAAMQELARSKQAHQTAIRQAAVGAEQAQTRLVRAQGAARVSEVRVKRTSQLAQAEKTQRAASADVARLKRSQRGRPYTPLDSIRMTKARTVLRDADSRLAAEQARIKGVAPAPAEQLFGAIQAAQEAAAASKGIGGSSDRIRGARQAVRSAEQAISVERARTAGVPPAQHTALMNAMAGRSVAHAELAGARAARQLTKAAHIQVKQHARTAPLTDPAATGRVFAHKADARTVANRQPFGAPPRPYGTDLPEHPLDAIVKKVGDKEWAVVPRVATTRLGEHYGVGTSKAAGAKAHRFAARSFRRAVLPLSAKFWTGQVGEPLFRSATEGATPLHSRTFRRVVDQMNKDVPGSGDLMRMRVTGGGQSGLGSVAREDLHGPPPTLADEFGHLGGKVGGTARGVSKVAATPGLRHVRAAWRAATDATMNAVNGQLEQRAQGMMAGKVMHSLPPLEGKLIGRVTDQAIKDLANHLQGSPAQVQLAHMVKDMYGWYSGHPPATREMLVHNTPFAPWYMNMVRFLTVSLPVKHPFKAALIANADALDEEWRKQHGLSFHGDNHLPDFLFGTAQTGAGSRAFGHFMPFAPGNIPASVAQLFYPQYGGAGMALRGFDYKGAHIKGGLKGVIENTLLGALEAHVGGLSQAGRITGITPRYIRRQDVPSVFQGKNIPKAILREFNPVRTMKKPADGGGAKSTGVNWGGTSGAVRRTTSSRGVNW